MASGVRTINEVAYKWVEERGAGSSGRTLHFYVGDTQVATFVCDKLGRKLPHDQAMYKEIAEGIINGNILKGTGTGGPWSRGYIDEKATDGGGQWNNVNN